MARTFHIKADQKIPVIAALIRGKYSAKVARLVFDTGAGETQFNTTFIEDLGYSARDALRSVSAFGPAGPIQQGYELELQELTALDVSFRSPVVSVYDFENISERLKIDGILGFDLIRQLHLEMDGPQGLLKIF